MESVSCIYLVLDQDGEEHRRSLDRNPGPGYDTLLLRIIPGYILSAFPHRQFHRLPSSITLNIAG